MSATSKGRVSIGALAAALVCAAALPGTAAAGIRKRRLSPAPSLKWRHLSVPLTEESISPSQELPEVRRADSL
jgi:hypothetical protein